MRDERGRGGARPTTRCVCVGISDGEAMFVSMEQAEGAVFVWRGLGRLYNRRRGIGRCGGAFFRR